MQEKIHWMQRANREEEALFTEPGTHGKDSTLSAREDHLNLNSTLIRTKTIFLWLPLIYLTLFLFKNSFQDSTI